MKFNKKIIALIISIIVSVFFVLVILGKPFLFPFPPRVEYDSPTCICYGSDASVVVDQAGERMLFLDDEHKLRRIEELDDSAEIDRAAVITDDGEHFFVSGYEFEENTDIISGFRVIRMDHNGKNSETILDYTNEDNKETNVVLDITAYDGSLYVVRNDLEAGTIIVTEYEIATGKSADIFTTQIPADYTAKYEPHKGLLYVNDFYGHMFKVSAENPKPEQILEDYIVENYIPTQDGGLLWLDAVNKNIYMNDKLLIKDTDAYYTICLSEEGVVFDNTADSRLSTLNLETGAVTNSYGADFSLIYLLISVVCTICIAYLGILVIILLFRVFYNLYSESDYVRIKRVGIVAVLAVVALVIALLYTNKIIEIDNQDIQEEISLQSHYFAESVDQQLLSDAVYTPEVGKDPVAWQKYQAACEKLEKEYSFFTERLDENNKNGHLSLYKKLGDKLVLVYESDSVSHKGYRFLYSDFAPLINSEEISIFTKSGYNKYYGMSPITNADGEMVGVAEYGMDYRMTTENIKTICIDMIVKLLSVSALIYVIFIELIEFFENRRKRKVLVKNKVHPHPETAMIRNLSFLIYTIEFMDNVVLVFVAKYLLQTSGMQETAFLLALPSLVGGIGLIIGMLIYNFVSNRLYVKSLTWIGGIAVFVMRALLCVSVFSCNFVLFCIMKFLSTLASTFLFSTLQMMRVKADDESERSRNFGQYSLGRTSGFIMGTLIAGFVVQDINRSVILYVISTVLVIPLFILFIRILPKKTHYVKPSSIQKTARSGGRLAFLFDKNIIIYFLFAMVPLCLIMGYQGYLLPLYSDAAKIPAIYVTTASVVASALLFMLAGNVEKLRKKYDHWKMLVFSIGLAGIAFMAFAVNSSIVWAMIMLLVVRAVEMISMPAREVVWNRQAKAKGIPLESVSTSVSMIHEVISALKETMISVFLFLGSSYACVAVGIFCVISIVIFALFTRKKAMAKAEV